MSKLGRLVAIVLYCTNSCSIATALPTDFLISTSNTASRAFSALVRPWQDEFQPPAVQVTINGIPRWMVMDTGSADIVIYTENTTCIAKGEKKPQSDCTFGDVYYGTYEPIKDMVFNQTYGTGQVIAGQFGYATVEVAGAVIKKQKVAFATESTKNGFLGTAGIFGLSPRQIEASFEAPEPSRANSSNHITYPTFFESLYNVTKQVKPFFSIALESAAAGGYLTFGGYPPMLFNHSFISTPFKGININNKENTNNYYPIQPDGYELNGNFHNTSYRTVVDSGTYVSRLPTEIAEKFNAAFDPPAKYDPAYSLYVTSCNATVPKFGVKIAGKTFYSDPANLLRAAGSVTSKCATAVTKGFDFSKSEFPDGFYVLGDLLMNGLVVVFDVGGQQLSIGEQSTS